MHMQGDDCVQTLDIKVDGIGDSLDIDASLVQVRA